MADVGLADYSQEVNSLDVGRLIEQFTDLESHAAQLRQTIAARNAANELLIKRQRTELSAILFRSAEPTDTAAEPTDTAAEHEIRVIESA
jgi:hypothetical protein